VPPPRPNGVGKDTNQGVVGRAGHGKLVHLFMGQEDHVGRAHPRQADALGRIPGKPVVVNRVVE